MADCKEPASKRRVLVVRGGIDSPTSGFQTQYCFDEYRQGQSSGSGRIEPGNEELSMRVVDNTVQASNLLTRSWVKDFSDEANQLVSGVGAWVLFTSLLGASSGDAQAELEAAMSLTRGEAASSVETQLELVDSLDGMSCAVGLWIHEDVPVRSRFLESIGRLTVASLPKDQRELDDWARDATGGLIEGFPGEIGEDTRLVMASALAAQADWSSPFEAGEARWRGDGDRIGWLYRESSATDSASLLIRDSLTVSRVICPTTGGFEVHLVTGSGTDLPGAVLDLAIDGLHGAAEIVPASELRWGDGGGCLTVEEAVVEPDTRLIVSLPAFEIQSSHDLLAHPELFGLVAATDGAKGHFPGLSRIPLVVESASQSAMAGFSESGFRAAAVTEMGLALGETLSEKSTVVSVLFDRPFGFLVVDPSSRLVLFAGWVVQPVQQVQEPGFEDERYVVWCGPYGSPSTQRS